jgi:hypothetical protein
MFKRLAKSGLVAFGLADFRVRGFRSRQPQRPALRGAGLLDDTLSSNTHSNDNLPGFRHPKGQHRIPTPALVCHWFDRNGCLECRWQAESTGDAPIGDFDEHGMTGRTSGLSSMKPRGLALAG